MPKPHSGRTDQRKAALKRKADAWALQRAGAPHSRGAAYLGGYAIECKIKAIAMEVFECWTLEELARERALDEREVYTHGLEALVNRLMPSGFTIKLQAGMGRQWSSVNRWRPSWRYDPRDWKEDDAETFLEAVDEVYRWLDSNRV
jgi:hypothetical protein